MKDRDLLEVGCGTGLLLRRLGPKARRAVGVDLSPGMLAIARNRGLTVVEADARALPFPDANFDVAVSFKTLPHVPDLRQALAELCRVVRPGGVVIAEVYNPISLRAWTKRFLPARRTSRDRTEADVFVRFDDEAAFRAAIPPGARIVATHGMRTVLPFGAALELPIVGNALAHVERTLATRWLAARFGGLVARVLQTEVR